MPYAMAVQRTALETVRFVLAAASAVALSSFMLPGCSACKKASCSTGPECKEFGLCGLRTFRAGEGFKACIPDSESNCLKSTACKREGLCHLDSAIHPERCVAKTAADCLATQECAALGRCTLSDIGTCVTSAAGCSRSSAMRAQQRTRPSHPMELGPPRPMSFRDRKRDDEMRCEPGPAGCDAACREEGACANQSGECLAMSADDCRKSAVCARNGRCSLDATTHTCVARESSDCAKADVCVRGGKDEVSSLDTRTCEARMGVDACTADFCKRFEYCAIRGDCHPSSGMCMPTEPKDCTDSLQCKVHGRCTYSGNNCFVTSPAECQASAECKAFGRCVYVPPPFGKGGECRNPSEGGTRGGACVDHDCWTEDRCLMRSDGPPRACVTPESVGLPRLTPLPPAPRLEMEAQVEGRHIPLLHATTFRRSESYGVVDLVVRLSDKPLSCSEATKTGGAAVFQLIASVGEPRAGYAKYRNHVNAARYTSGRTDLHVDQPSARIETRPREADHAVLLDLDLDAHAPDGSTMSIHGALVATSCPK